MFQSFYKIITWRDFHGACKHRLENICKLQKDVKCFEGNPDKNTMLMCPMWNTLRNFYTKNMRTNSVEHNNDYISPIRSKDGKSFNEQEFEEGH